MAVPEEERPDPTRRDGAPELAQRLPRLLDIMVSIGGDVELHTLLDRVVAAAAELAGARYAALAVLNDEGGVGEFVTRGIGPETRALIGRPPGSYGLIRALVEGRGPLLLHDLTKDPRFHSFPPGHPVMRSLLGVPIRVHDAGYGALYVSEIYPGAFTREDLQLLQILATEAGIAIGNAQLYEAVRQRARWMDGSAELSTSLLSGDVDDALAVVAEQAKRLADTDAAMVLVHTEEGGLEVVAACGEDPGRMIGVRLPPTSQLLPQLRAGEPVFIEDAATDPRLNNPLSYRYGPSMVLPLASDGKALGALVLPRLAGAPQFTFAERAMANQFAQQAAVALMLSEARDDRERLAVFEDRDRIARDLHDLVIQRLFATGMMLETARRATDDQRVQRRITGAVDELDATIQEIRTAIFALQQSPEEVPSGLRTRVLRETGTAARSLGFQPSVSFTGAVDARVGENAARNLIAALREALSNTARHSGAGRVEVVVDATGELPDGRASVRLTVSDNGVGLPDRDIRRSGLRNLAQRAERLGGRTEFGPGLGEAGTTVGWEVPL